MGNTPSSRRVTVVNDDVVGVVQVTENVVRRLRGEDEKPATDSKKTTEKEIPEPEVTAPSPGYVSFYPAEPYSTTLEQRQKFHEEFKKAEKSWQNRINGLEMQNQQLFLAANDKLAATLTEIETNHMKNTYAPVCPDKQQQVLKCYKENSKFPLRCSQEVHDFVDCVDKARMSVLVKGII